MPANYPPKCARVCLTSCSASCHPPVQPLARLGIRKNQAPPPASKPKNSIWIIQHTPKKPKQAISSEDKDYEAPPKKASFDPAKMGSPDSPIILLVLIDQHGLPVVFRPMPTARSTRNYESVTVAKQLVFHRSTLNSLDALYSYYRFKPVEDELQLGQVIDVENFKAAVTATEEKQKHRARHFDERQRYMVYDALRSAANYTTKPAAAIYQRDPKFGPKGYNDAKQLVPAEASFGEQVNSAYDTAKEEVKKRR